MTTEYKCPKCGNCAGNYTMYEEVENIYFTGIEQWRTDVCVKCETMESTMMEYTSYEEMFGS